MKISANHGIISVLNFSPYEGSEADIALRNQLIESSINQSQVTPDNRLDVYDETFLVFSDSSQAMDFLVTLTTLSQSEIIQINLRTGLCCGEYYIHQDQIYGDAINMSTKLSCSARENEILVCSSNCKEIEQYINLHNNLSYYQRDQDTFSISLLDDECTQTNSIKSSLKITVAGASKHFTATRHKAISIGRSEDCDIFIDSDQVSRMHATLTLKFDEIIIDDHSSNGTFLYIENREIYLAGDSMRLPPTGEIYFGKNKTNGTQPEELHISYALCDTQNSTFL